jgi:hypothetical protein
MSGAKPPLPQYAFMAWCLVKAQGQLYLYHISEIRYAKCRKDEAYEYVSSSELRTEPEYKDS